MVATATIVIRKLVHKDELSTFYPSTSYSASRELRSKSETIHLKRETQKKKNGQKCGRKEHSAGRDLIFSATYYMGNNDVILCGCMYTEMQKKCTSQKKLFKTNCPKENF